MIYENKRQRIEKCLVSPKGSPDMYYVSLDIYEFI